MKKLRSTILAACMLVQPVVGYSITASGEDGFTDTEGHCD